MINESKRSLRRIAAVELDSTSMHYLDNAATVFPKPAEVLTSAFDMYRQFGVNPGRSGYDLCLFGGNIVETTRKQLTSFFGGTSPDRLCFTNNASDALNILIQGIVKNGDHVLSTQIEHNSVIRPLNHLERDRLIRVDYVPVGSDGIVDPDDIIRRIRTNTRVIVVNHGSNVIGTIQPLGDIGRICSERQMLFIVDTAQTAGLVPIDIDKMHISALAFTGHKSLLGPTGIGGLYVSEGVEIRPTRFGGTGVRSAHPYHLDEYPYRLEVGTLNVLGIAGLHAAQTYLEREGIGSIYRHEMELFARLQDGLSEIPGVTLHGSTSMKNRIPVLSFTVDGWDPSDVGTFLDVDYNVACRTGLQCAPLIHKSMGTAPRGTIRFSIGPMTSDRDVDEALYGVAEIARIAPS